MSIQNQNIAECSNEVALFFDTNIALHYKRIDQIDWSEMFHHKEIDIYVSPIISRELDRAKTVHSSKKIRDRASEYSKWLFEKFDSPSISKNTKLHFITTEPLINYVEQRLDKDNYDDQLIATTIEFSKNHPKTEIFVITADLGLSLKLKTRKIDVKNLDQKYKLPEELSPEEKETRTLRAEVEKFKNRQPKLNLTFDDNKNRIYVGLRKLNIAKNEYIEKNLVGIKTKYPKRELNSQSSNDTERSKIKLTGLNLFPAIHEHAAQSIATYNYRIEAYYSKYESYLIQKYEFYERELALIKLPLKLSNVEGTLAANSIDIFVSCDECYSLLANLKQFKAPESPTAPQEIGVANIPFLHPPYFGKSMSDLLKENLPDTPKLFIEKNTAKFTLKELKHNQNLDLMDIWIDFGGVEKMKNTVLTFAIHCTELITPIKGELHLIYESK